jgi:EpsD family peptidyl-prolyl cis-trans isomerase
MARRILHLQPRAYGPRGVMLALVVLCGCHAKAPVSPVLATVNGQDVTQGDFASDLAANTRLKALGSAAQQRAVLNALVDRKLLVQLAKQQGLDASPAYLALRDRLDEIALAQQVMLGWAAQTPTPTTAEAQAFIDQNPQMFSQRQVYVLDQIRTGDAGLNPKALENFHAMEAVEAYLREDGRVYHRGATTLDTVTLPAAVARRLASLTPGEPLVIQGGGLITISAVRQAEATPTPDAERLSQAARALRDEAVQRTVRDRLALLRGGAKISYFAPSAAPSVTP